MVGSANRGLLARHPMLLLAPATFFQGYDLLAVSLALPLIREEFHLTISQSGFLVSAVFAGSFGVFAFLPLADRFGRRPLLVVTVVGYTIASFLTAFSRGIAEFIIYQFISHAFLTSEDTLSVIVVVELADPDKRGRALAVLASAAALGQAAAGGGFLAILALHGSWRLLYLLSVPPLILVALARRGLPETLRHEGKKPQALHLLPGRLLIATSVLSFCIALFPGAVTALASTLVLDVWHMTIESLRPQYFLVWLLAASGFFVAGKMLDRVGRRPTSALFFFGTAVAGLVCFPAVSTFWRVVGLGLVIFTITGSTPCFAAYSTEIFPPGLRGRAGALLQGVALASNAAAPAIAAALSRPLEGIGPALGAVGLSYVAAAATVFFFMPETRTPASPGSRDGNGGDDGGVGRDSTLPI